MRPVAFVLPLLLLLPAGAAFAQAPGSYRRSCTDVSQDGPILTARCRGSNGEYNESSIDVGQCRGQPIANSFGRLTCGNVGGSARPEGLPRYQNRDDYGTAGPGYSSDAPRHRRHRSDDADYGYAPPPVPRYAPPPPNDDDQ